MTIKLTKEQKKAYQEFVKCIAKLVKIKGIDSDTLIKFLLERAK